MSGGRGGRVVVGAGRASEEMMSVLCTRIGAMWEQERLLSGDDWRI